MAKVNFIKNVYPLKNLCSVLNYDFKVVLYKKYLYFLSDKILARIENNQTASTKELLTIENLDYHFKKIDIEKRTNKVLEEDVLILKKMSPMDKYDSYNRIKMLNATLDQKTESMIFFKKIILSNFLAKNYKTVYKRRRVEVRFIHEFGNIKVIASPYNKTSIKTCKTEFSSFVNFNKLRKYHRTNAKLDFSCNCFVLEEILDNIFTSNIIAIKYNSDKNIIFNGLVNKDKIEIVLS